MMPFGLKAAPATFQRLMDGVIPRLDGFVSAYLDDVMKSSESFTAGSDKTSRGRSDSKTTEMSFGNRPLSVSRTCHWKRNHPTTTG